MGGEYQRPPELTEQQAQLGVFLGRTQQRGKVGNWLKGEARGFVSAGKMAHGVLLIQDGSLALWRGRKKSLGLTEFYCKEKRTSHLFQLVFLHQLHFYKWAQG